MIDAAEQLVVNRWLASLDEHKASDLILSVGNPPTLRIQSQLFPLPNEALLVPDFMRRLSESWLTPGQLKQLAEKKQVAFGLTMANRRRFKIDVFFQSSFLSMTLRLVPDRVPSMEQLGLPPQAANIIQAERGLLIVCGPFGSGCTTTVAAMVNWINKNKTKHIVTFEDPIEYQYADDKSIIEQRELDTDVPNMEEALDFMLNEDVDVIVMSPGKNFDYLPALMDLVTSGRLVILTVNTDSAVHALEKVVNSYPASNQSSARITLANVLVGVVNQRMVPTLGGGQALTVELLLPTERVRSVIQTDDLYKLNAVLQTDQVDGLISLDQSLANLVRSGDVTRETAISFALDQKALIGFMGGMGTIQ